MHGGHITFATGSSTLGAVLVAQSRSGICAVSLGDHADGLVRQLQELFPGADLAAAEPSGGGPGDSLEADVDAAACLAQVIDYIENPQLGRASLAAPPLDVRGTQFQQRVWRVLRQVPVGQVVTYAELARRIGSPTSYRAVAQACGANALAVVVPCHRAVRVDGALAGYRWGVERKRALLEREGAL